MLKYIYSNTIQDEKSIVRQVVDFVNSMLYFKSLRDGNTYMGYSNGSDNLSNLIIKKDKLKLLCCDELQELTFLQLLFYVLDSWNKGGMRYVDDPSREPYLCLSIQL